MDAPQRNGLPQNPIFVVGYPRSGTTLMQSMLVTLTTSPCLLSFPETHYFNVLEKVVAPTGKLVSHDSLRNSRDLLVEKTGLAQKDAGFNRLCDLARRRELTSQDLFERIVSENLRTRKDRTGVNSAFRWVEKTPYHANFLPRIFRMYPEARCVFMVRHPVPAVMSRKHHFPFNRLTPLEELGRHWERMGINVMEASNRFPDRVLTIRYEALVTDPERWVAELSRFLKISMDSGRLNQMPDKAKGLILNNEPWKTGNLRPGMRNANAKYRGRVSREEAARIESVTAEGMNRMGYGSFFSFVDEGIDT